MIAAAAGTLALTWSDCGGAHGTTKDVQPTTITLGQTTDVVGTGTTDKAITGGTYDMHITAGGGLINKHFTGNNCEAKEFDLPLGIGKLSWAGIDCPLAAGDTELHFSTQLAGALPASMAKSDISMTAVDQDGEAALCVNIHMEKQDSLASADVDCTKAACPDQCTCSLDKCAAEINTCLSDSVCAQSQDCAMACPCSDTACSLACAAKSPSIKALPVAKCINSNCAATLKTADVDCTKAACPDQCTCSLDKCAAEINTCLSDSVCAQSQDCAMACPCSDTACSLACAAKSPSIKALPVAKCINSNCAAGVSV